MSKANTPISESNLIENDTQYEVVPRRRSERRSTGQPDIKSKFSAVDNDIKVQKVENTHIDLADKGEERRQSGRRSSKPTLLSVDEIAILRKK
tara:strand:- start:85891 stop:86169 length:279 start_codon:yes stop_codon:yes gene_type:complete